MVGGGEKSGGGGGREEGRGHVCILSCVCGCVKHVFYVQISTKVKLDPSDDLSEKFLRKPPMGTGTDCTHRCILYVPTVCTEIRPYIMIIYSTIPR